MSSRAGYVLVGGRSSRMGSDKALLKYGDGTLAQMVARAVVEAAGQAILVGNPKRYGSLGYRAIPDIVPGAGPLGGILTALADSAADWTLVVGCDMPGLTGAFLIGLMEAAERSDGEALAPAGPGGLVEPLCAVYHRDARAKLRQAFERGVRKVAAALQELRLVTLSLPETAYFQNVNTPEDWSAHAG